MQSIRQSSRVVIATIAAVLLALSGASAQEAKVPSWWQSLIDFSRSAQEVKPKFIAPPLKPLTEKLPGAFYKAAPEGVEELKAMQEHVAQLVEKISPAVVSVRVGASFGSGVIVTKDGYILTAGHVSGAPNRDVAVYFHGGKTAKGKTLGGNHGIDSGMIKIVSGGEFPFAEMGDCQQLKKGDWCMVCAHPGGFKPGRTPPVRLGRLLNKTDSTLTTDCALVGGDSGGPLFDMHGRVIGINSRIGQSLAANMHVPVNPYREHWDKIAKAEVFGGNKFGVGGFGKGGPFLGVQSDAKADGCHITAVTPNSPADKAGLKVNDIIKKFGDKELNDSVTIADLIRMRKAGDTIVLEVRRGDETLKLKVEIGKR